MNRELCELLRGIGEKEDLIRAWAVEVSPTGSSVHAQTRRSFRRAEDALAAARTLLDELVQDSRRRVRTAAPGTTIDDLTDQGRAWRGVVDVELAPV
jgi:hypothetical protein